MNSVTKQQLMEAIYPYFKVDERMCLLVGDMGFAVTDEYFNNFPARTFNIGIAEQGAMGMVAGMALTGLIPLYYSQIPFLVLRAFEQIRYDICEHNLNVKLIGVGADNFFIVSAGHIALMKMILRYYPYSRIYCCLHQLLRPSVKM